MLPNDIVNARLILQHGNTDHCCVGLVREQASLTAQVQPESTTPSSLLHTTGTNAVPARNDTGLTSEFLMESGLQQHDVINGKPESAMSTHAPELAKSDPDLTPLSTVENTKIVTPGLSTPSPLLHPSITDAVAATAAAIPKKFPKRDSHPTLLTRVATSWPRRSVNPDDALRTKVGGGGIVRNRSEQASPAESLRAASRKSIRKDWTTYWRSEKGKERRQKIQATRRRRLARIEGVTQGDRLMQDRVAETITHNDALNGTPTTQEDGQVYSSVTTGPRGEYGWEKFDIINGKKYPALAENATEAAKLFYDAVYKGVEIRTVFQPYAG